MRTKTYLFFIMLTVLSCTNNDEEIVMAKVSTISPPISIGLTNATIQGEVTYDGGYLITARGICWSTSPNPTIELTTKTIEGTGKGTFQSSISLLSSNTSYYVRAYATNQFGTAYGNEIIFKTLECISVVSASKLSAVDQTQLQKDIAIIDAYVSTNGITNVVKDPTGLRYKISVQGTGTKPCLQNKITVKYTGKLLSNGSQFDTQTNASFPLDLLILGWQIGIPKMQVGSKSILYIPSGYAYGTSGGAGGAIPPNANLIFEVELIN